MILIGYKTLYVFKSKRLQYNTNIVHIQIPEFKTLPKYKHTQCQYINIVHIHILTLCILEL